MFYKSIILTMVSSLGILIFFNTETYKAWTERYVKNPDITEQFDKTSTEERKQYRFGSLYMLCQYMKNTLDTSVFKEEPIVLLPPNDYLKAKESDIMMPEPSVFYYHIGIKTVWTNSVDVQKANWAIISSGKSNMAFVPIRSNEQRQQLLDLYKNYKPAL